MKRSGAAKFPHSVQLFKFCQKVMIHQKGEKVRDQEVGAILNFNPSDCSHWKRGEKNVRSVFALAKLAETLKVETGLIHDVTSGNVNLDEAFFEYIESANIQNVTAKLSKLNRADAISIESKIIHFVNTIQEQCEFTTPPLYLPEVMRSFAFVSSQPVDMLDKLSRILRIKANRYCIQFKKGDLKPQTRMSMVKDLAKVVLQGERERFPELGPFSAEKLEIEELLFTANLLLPKKMLKEEWTKLDTRKNVVSELSTLFWVPKSLVGYQLQEIILNYKEPVISVANQEEPIVNQL
ncbi:MAG: ImmA/IrrE family metallo-endopeptidase [Pseudobacteriovorax sp.]|nr:ImmA/IrrE family metallo-endopeptidase [Pseudobacteriovorax sp.]